MNASLGGATLAENVSKEISRLKRVSSAGCCVRMEVGEADGALLYLRAVPDDLDAGGSDAPELISAWRNANSRCFFTWVETTPGSTRKWLDENYCRNDFDVLFIVETVAKRPFGHVALYNFDFDSRVCELGRVVRGESLGPRGGMARAVKRLVEWAFQDLHMLAVHLEVFEDNEPAVRFYRCCGFSIESRSSLRPVRQDGVTRWIPVVAGGTVSRTAEKSRIRMVRRRWA